MAHPGQSSSQTSIGFPYGQQVPAGYMTKLWNQYASPLLQGFGAQLGPNAAKMEQRLLHAGGPLAQLIQGVQGLTPQLGPESSKLGATTAARGSEAFTGLHTQVQDFLQANQGYQAEANTQLGQADRSIQDAFGGPENDALFSQSATRFLQALRPQEAAGGLESSGAGRQMEATGLQNLSYQFAQDQFSREQAALQTGQQALQTAQGVAQAGIPAAQAMFPAIQQAQDAQSQQFMLPFQTYGNLLQMLTQGQAPTQQLLAQAGPMALPSSQSKQYL